MPDRGEHGGDVPVDAVTQQLQQLRITAHFRDLRDQHLMHRARQFGHSQVQAAHDLRRRPTDGRGVVMASLCHHDQTLAPLLSPEDKTPPRFGRPATSCNGCLTSDSCGESIPNSSASRRKLSRQ
jgi:hypothetical protein